MSNVINKNTLEYKTSVGNTSYYQTQPDWVVNPTVPDCPKKYWKKVSDTVYEEMTQQEKDVVDNAPVTYKRKTVILNEIFNGCANEAQVNRLLDALDKYSSFSDIIGDAPGLVNYALARARMQKALDAEDILQADYDLIDSVLPK